MKANYINPKIYNIDLFCGVGGLTKGSQKFWKTIACVNHDPEAIEAHSFNHPKALHFTEDVRSAKVVEAIRLMVEKIRKKEPHAIINLWASLECTNFSKAKGGQPKNADSRSLAEHMPMYLEAIKPDYFFVENVEEFLDWGPLDENGHPVKELKGQHYLQWVNEIKSFGFDYEKQLLNAADFGACQSRLRLFIQFAKSGLPLRWPLKTHQKKGLFGLKKWVAVKKVLDFSDEGNSIFGRKKPLVEASLRRIYIGLIKEIAGGKQAFLNQYNGGENRIISIDSAINTVPTQNRFALFSAVFLSKYYGTGDNVQSVNTAAPTIPCHDRVSAHWLNGFANWIDRQYKTPTLSSIDEPIGTIPCVPKASLIKCIGFIVNPSHGGHVSSINASGPTVIARQDKAPLYLIQTTVGDKPVFTATEFFNDMDLQLITDSQNGVYGPMIEKSVRLKIVEFMFMYGISDIKQRMLKVSELLPIQGFPKDYKLVGSQKTQKKHIGNAVEVGMATALAKAHFEAIKHYQVYKLSA